MDVKDTSVEARDNLRARHGRAGGLSPAGPGRGGAGAVAHHHPGVLPAGPGPGHGDRAGPHAARRCSHRSRRTGPRWDRRTSRALVRWLVRRGPGGTGPGPERSSVEVRVRSPSQDQNGPQGGSRHRLRDQDTDSPGDRPGAPDRQQAYRSGKNVSRRALRSEGIRGSNQALNALAARINAELADTAALPASPDHAAA